ncbi:MAG: chemotaxis protein MotB [Candidatus Zixiibacteriota bacterium]|nr:MAG: chemotaxis protein MotB [candidate division Zixibacteria bacterium]
MNRIHWVPLFIAALLAGGCVSTGTYEKKVEEARLLDNTVKALESEYAGLLKQKEGLVLEKKDLTQNLTAALQQSADLQQDLVSARADTDRLERVLSTRSQEAGQAMAEMRQNIDRLEGDNRRLQQQITDLASQVEKERVARETRVAEVKSTYDELGSKMESEITRGEITISDLQGRLTVNMVERILFDSGRADVKPAGLEVLRRVGEILGGVKEKEIRVEGHSDNIPISTRLAQTFPSNWELSTARATNVVHFLQEKVGIPGERLSACGFSEFRPVADNATSEGRAQNRRIQIVLVPIEERVEAPPTK